MDRMRLFLSILTHSGLKQQNVRVVVAADDDVITFNQSVQERHPISRPLEKALVASFVNSKSFLPFSSRLIYHTTIIWFLLGFHRKIGMKIIAKCN